MAFYRERIFPRVMNLLMNDKENRRIRARVCGGVSGDVVEIGFGSGHNLPFLLPSVTTLRVVEPSRLAVKLAAERVAAAPFPVQVIGPDGECLPMADQSAEAVLCTWALCSIADPVAAVREVRRVLRPGGRLHFVEHGAAPEPEVRAWQDRLNGVQKRLACGCNLNRDIPALIAAGGLQIDHLETFYAAGAPKSLGWTFEGTASIPT